MFTSRKQRFNFSTTMIIFWYAFLSVHCVQFVMGQREVLYSNKTEHEIMELLSYYNDNEYYLRYDRLNVLRVTNSNFTTISSYLFPYSIDHLEISNCQVKHIDNNAFLYVETKLDLNSNYLSNMSFVQTLSSSLWYLNLSNNYFENIPNVFTNFKSLEVLDISKCRIQFIDNNTILPNLRVLNINLNLIKSIYMNPDWNYIEIDMSFNYLNEVKIIFPSNEWSSLSVSNSNFGKNKDNFMPLKLKQFIAENASISTICDLKYDDLENLILSNNNISDILCFSNNKQFNRLKYLNISWNYIKILPKNAFNQYEYLNKLDLSHNLINNISANVFKSNKYISYLNLSHNNISFLENNVFSSIDYLFELDLSFNPLQQIPGDSFVNNNNLGILRITNCKINQLLNLNVQQGTLVDFSFNFINKISNITLKTNSLILKYNSLSNITINNMEINDIDLSYNNITSWPNLTVQTIRTLNLSNNNIQSIGDNRILINIENLDLSRNKIQQFSSIVKPYPNVKNLIISMFGDFRNSPFIGMTHLQSLNITNSYLCLSNEFFFGLFKLTKLHFNNVEIISIEPFAFKSLRKIEFLDVRKIFENQTVLEENIFVGLSSLFELNLESLSIREIEQGAFNGLNSIRNIILKNNKIEILGKNIFDNLPTLKILDLSFNAISHLDVNSFVGLSGLQELLLKNNSLHHISIGTFKPLTNLIKLDLNQNRIYSISFGTFSFLSNLEELDLSYNNMSRLEATVFFPLKSLRSLDLSGNHLIEIKHEFMIESLRGLVFIGLNNNKWRCAPLAKMLQQFENRAIRWTPLTDPSNDYTENIDGIRCIDICKHLYCDETHVYS